MILKLSNAIRQLKWPDRGTDFSLKGSLYLSGYILLTALSGFHVHKVNQHLSPFLTACHTFIVCLGFYSLLNPALWFSFKRLREKIFSLLVLNVTTAGCWICMFYALRTLQPTLFFFLYFGTMKTVSILMYQAKRLQGYCLAACLLLLILSETAHVSWTGCLAACLGGCSAILYSLFSKKLVHYFSATEMLALRFPLTIFITFLACLWQSPPMPMNLSALIIFFPVALSSVILPLFLFQKAIHYLPVATAIAWLPLVPLCCLLLAALSGQSPAVDAKTVLLLPLFLSMIF